MVYDEKKQPDRVTSSITALDFINFVYFVCTAPKLEQNALKRTSSHGNSEMDNAKLTFCNTNYNTLLLNI